MSGAVIVWFRQDLRLWDNPALHAAAATGQPVIPVYIWSPEEDGEWAPGGASRWWLHNSLLALRDDLQARGSRLILARGRAADVLTTLVSKTGATAVHWNKRYEPTALACSRAVQTALARESVRAVEFNGALLSDPAEFLNKSGHPYQVYTAFQRALMHTLDPGTPVGIPRALRSPARWPPSASVQALQVLPKAKWHTKLAATWRPGEAAARASLTRFLRNTLEDYGRDRDIPGMKGTSRLSPHLHFGEIGPRQIWHALGARGRNSPFCRQIVWREFAYHLLHHFPHTTNAPLRPQFRQFPWHHDRRRTHAWERGCTGIPLVDAGMRELWATGWMHNRARLVVGSFLVKNLLVPWQDGARWFWDTLVDADLANNTLNWQWVAGCGADAAPYFRIFNPDTQARRFDPDKTYIRRWIPELRRPQEYPRPIVDLGDSREAALEAYQRMRRAGRSGTRVS